MNKGDKRQIAQGQGELAGNSPEQAKERDRVAKRRKDHGMRDGFAGRAGEPSGGTGR